MLNSATVEKAAIHSTKLNGRDCVPTKLYSQKQLVRQICVWTVICSPYTTRSHSRGGTNGNNLRWDSVVKSCMCRQRAEEVGELGEACTQPVKIMTAVACVSRSLPPKIQEKLADQCRVGPGAYIWSEHASPSGTDGLSMNKPVLWGLWSTVCFPRTTPHLILLKTQSSVPLTVQKLWAWMTRCPRMILPCIPSPNFFWSRAWDQYFLVSGLPVYPS